MSMQTIDAETGDGDEGFVRFAHDLRTPLTAIRSLSEILLDNPDLAASERQRFLSIVVEESKRLHRQIERVLRIPAAPWNDAPPSPC